MGRPLIRATAQRWPTGWGAAHAAAAHLSAAAASAASAAAMSRSTLRRSRGMPMKMEMRVVPEATMALIQACRGGAGEGGGWRQGGIAAAAGARQA